ncbi:MAG: type I DNA topoisomerase [Planctomycetes bacterium]|nr:type I DNA topoisomerase [Planctomycetota bacterium]
MPKAVADKQGKALVIVESPAKARTISRFLGRNFDVEASIGHIRDLPGGAKEVPAEYRGTAWARLGVNVEQGFSPLYIVPADKKQQVNKLKQALKGASQLYLATDEDREGEAISWHLCEVLKPKVPVKRLVFHEITEEAILESLENARQIDDQLVRAQETRRILDRLYGYEVSPLLWRKIGPGLSAGRVQSVALRLIVERERQRMAFVSASYFDIVGSFQSDAGRPFQAELTWVDGKRIPTGKDFDSSTGKLRDANLCLLNQSEAEQLVQSIRKGPFAVGQVEDKPYSTSPAPPFTTSSMQQEANRKLGYSARRTMDLAQSLYENGYITYMRTDSTSLAKVAVDAARDLVRTEYGAEYLPDRPRHYSSKVKNAQEAHEAIRPAGHPFKLPESLRGELTPDQFRLFDLIWKRTIASQMADARGHLITLHINGEQGTRFRASGKSIDFPGFLRAYVEGSDDPEADLADRETVLPRVRVGESIACVELTPKSHVTQPPARFSEASLTQTLEDKGIGRPSTYASIIETILERRYVFKKGNALVPRWLGFSVVRLLEEHLSTLVDYDFTAQMEDLLDEISRGETEHLPYLNRFYFGGGDAQGLHATVEKTIKDVDARHMSRFLIGTPDSGESIHVRVGRFGPFLEQGTRRASVPDDIPPDELTLSRALELLDQSAKAETPLGFCPSTNRPVYLRQGRFGAYVQLGRLDPDNDDEPVKNASLLKGMNSSEVTVEVALQLLALPRTVGVDPRTQQEIVAHNGRFGPYVKCGDETRSLPAEISPLQVSLEQALQLLSVPKTTGRRRSAPKEPLKVFPPSPVTSEPIRLMSGYYGPYVTDGQTNASLPKDLAPEALTFEQATMLLAERAAKGPAKKRGRAAKKGTVAKVARKTPRSGGSGKKASAGKRATKKVTSPGN